MNRVMISRAPMKIILLVSALFIIGCSNEELIKEKDRELNSYKSSIDELSIKNNRLKDEVDSFTDKNQTLKGEITSLKNKISSFAKEKEEFLNKNEELLSAKKELEAKLAALDRNFSKTKDETEKLKELLESEISKIKQEMEEKVTGLKKALSTKEEGLSKKEMIISELEGKLTLTILDQILFDVGSDTLKKEGYQVLDRIGSILKGQTNKRILIEGHTDNLPIKAPAHNPNYSNWELSAGRALNVLHFLQDKIGIPGERLSAICYGENRPVADNATKEGRAANRRIQIVLSQI